MGTENIYQMYNNKTIDKSSSIEIQLGKQKKKRFKATSVFFTVENFARLEETIHYNFREYSSNSNAKISSKEWMKIIEGFKKLSELLKDPKYNIELLELLDFKSYEQKQYQEDYLSVNKNINQMLIEFIAWLELNLKNSDYITITA